MASPLIVFLAAALVAAPAANADDPKDWRDKARPGLRRTWDRLEGKAPPPLKFLGGWMNTKARSWKNLRGKVVLIDMWATWCQPCVQSIPHLQQMHKRHAKDGLVVLGVHSARGFKSMPNFVKRRKLKYSFAADEKAAFGSALGLQFIPCYFVVDRKGVMRVAGAKRDKLDQIVAALLEEPVPEGVEEPVSDAEPDADGAVEEGGVWPDKVAKKLYANDFRGKPAPVFAVGEWLTKEPDRKGKVLLIDFWATWCGGCREAIPKLNEFHRKFKDDLVIVGISDEPRATVESVLQDTKFDYAQAIDTQARMKKQLGIRLIPHVLIVTSDGIVRWQGIPSYASDPLTAKLLREVIRNDPGVQARRKAAKKQAP